MAKSKKKQSVGFSILLIVGIVVLAGIIASVFVFKVLNSSSLIPDKAFTAAVASYYEKMAVRITKEDLEGIQYLQFNSSSSITLGGAEAAAHYTGEEHEDDGDEHTKTVSLTGEIKDLETVLALLPNLRYFSANSLEQVTSFKQFEAQKGLVYLGVNGCPVASLEGLDALSELKTLDLGKTAVTDLGALKNLTALETLTLSGAKSADLSTLPELSALTTLTASSMDLTDLSSFPKLSALTKLVVSSNKLTSLNGVASFAALEEINFSNNEVADLTPLAGVSTLKKAVASSNGLTDPTAVTALEFDGEQTVTIDVSGNEFTDWAPIREYDKDHANVTITGYAEGEEPEEEPEETGEEPVETEEAETAETKETAEEPETKETAEIIED